MARWSAVLITFFLTCPLAAQVHVVSPLPRGIIQVRGNDALLHFRASVPLIYQHFAIKLSSDIDTTDPFTGMTRMDPVSGWIDTILRVPKSLRNYALCWLADSSGVPRQGTIPGLTPGHIFGIAGQSNAEGENFEMNVEALGDIRMMRSEKAWEPAREPTGFVAGGPWIVMANELYKMIGDTLPIGIVNTAVGGTGLIVNEGPGLWQRDPIDPHDSIYSDALRKFREAGSILEVLCWIQGETDGTVSISLLQYRIAFQKFMSDLQMDLGDTFAVFHLQMQGWSYPEVLTSGFPAVREAQRSLELSTLVGTGLGRSVASDGLHYSVSTFTAVGRMFADAILTTKYSTNGTGLYPPLMPDTVATLDSTNNPNVIGHYCISLRWSRGGLPIPLTSVTDAQYFALEMDGTQVFDTSKVWYRVSEDDPSTVQIGLRNSALDPRHVWQVTYDANAGGDNAPLATLDPFTHDTIFATAFYRLPIVLAKTKAVVQSGVPAKGIISIGDAIQCPIFVEQNENVNVTIHDALGSERLHGTYFMRPGQDNIDFYVRELPSGCYWLGLQHANGAREVTKVLIIR